MPEVAPGQIGRVIRLEKGPFEPERAVGEANPFPSPKQQHAAVVARGFAGKRFSPVSRDRVAFGFREPPRFGVEGEVELGDLENAWAFGHRSSAPLETITAEPPIDADRKSALRTSKPRTIRLARPISNSLLDHKDVLAVGGPIEGERDACEGRRRASRRGILGDAPAAAEHAGVERRVGIDDLARIEVGRRAAVLAPRHAARPGAGDRCERTHRHEQKRRAGAEQAWLVPVEADVAFREAEPLGDLGVGWRRLVKPLRQARKGEVRGQRLADAAPDEADDVADLFLEHDAQILRGDDVGRADIADQARPRRSSDGRRKAARGRG